MSTTIEVDLKDVLAKLDQKLDKIDQKFDQKFDRMELKFDALTKDVADLKTTVAKDVAELKTEVKILQERVNAGQAALEKRIDGQAFWLRGVGITVVGSLVAIGLKVFGVGIH